MRTGSARGAVVRTPGDGNRQRATAERMAQADAADGAASISAPQVGAPAGVQRLTAAPLDRLHVAGYIADGEYLAGDMLRADAYLAAVNASTGHVDWNATGGRSSSRVPVMFSAQVVADATLRVRAVHGMVRGVAWDVLHWCVVMERDLAATAAAIFGVRDAREGTVAGRAALRVALGTLADAYGRIGEEHRRRR